MARDIVEEFPIIKKVLVLQSSGLHLPVLMLHKPLGTVVPAGSESTGWPIRALQQVVFGPDDYLQLTDITCGAHTNPHPGQEGYSLAMCCIRRLVPTGPCAIGLPFAIVRVLLCSA
jgi:hypothetical protein